MEIFYVLTFVLALIIGLILVYPIIFLCKKLKVSQTTLHYVEKHSSKSGTPTMGGVIFIVSAILGCFWFFRGEVLTAWLCLLVMVGYGVLGFLDDFIKVRFHQNEGLRPYQKIIGQVGIAIIMALYVFFKVGTSLDFFGVTINLGWFIIPFVMLVYLATTNSVNLTDGLDGLAGGVSLVFLIFFGIILTMTSGQENLALCCFSMVGGLLAFLSANAFPAKIFMGDTGSLALGGFIASVCCLSGKALLLPIIGLMFVLSALSDIIQVLHYKRTKKRIFLMAPLHHHFEQKGVNENRIVVIYIVMTTILGALCLCLELVF